MNFPFDLIPSHPISPHSFLPFIGLYAESHFKFWIPLSRFFKAEPELIFDTPWRLEPGQTPTIFLVIKDAHLHPVLLINVDITVHQQGKLICSEHWELDRTINDSQTQLEFSLTDCTLPYGEVLVSPSLNYEVGGKILRLEIDNYDQIAKLPLRITIADEMLPVLPGWLSGDTHLHSSLTNDQVEFGASLEQTRKAAQLFGLDFITATDHSYDLDDQPDDYTKNDPELKKWHASRHRILEMNNSDAPTIVPGEEISVANARGAIVHLLHFNDDQFFPGSGDSGEDWPNLHSQYSIAEVLAKRSHNTVSVGAHSAYKFPWLQRLLLNRGFWETKDHENPGLDGVQILCGTPASSNFQNSRTLWIESLLKGFQLSAYGGSDGHGNFNRNWHVKMPAWSLGIHEDQIFAQARTLLRCNSNKMNDLIEAMKLGRTALSTGPVGDLVVTVSEQRFGIGDTLLIDSQQEMDIHITGVSTIEFGSQMDVTLYLGELNGIQESILYREEDLNNEFERHIPFTPITNSYLRIELTSEGSRWPGVYISSPIWINISESSA
ncbi:hypothetical protein HQ531_10855 [bacterium]|nr:hypothetical protein [bacterium]